MPQVQRRLITYCSNIHPGDSWDETFAALRAHVPRIRAAIAPERPFPIGLRLSARAARGLASGHLGSFRGWLQEHNCFIPTVNGFPYGPFHGERVKEEAYLPDWRSRERVEYTRLLANLLAGWLPGGGFGSISTVPVGFRAHLAHSDFPGVRHNLLDALQHLHLLGEERGVDLVLALEPEPGCLLETAEELVEFVEGMKLPPTLRSRIGICIDCCHHAIQFEEPAELLSLLAGAGIRIGKVQVSSALRQRQLRPEVLERFQEPRYLHQVVLRRSDGSLSRYSDLADALREHRGKSGDEWRCHFHLPLFLEESEELQTTRFFAEELLGLIPPETLLEVETYSWSVLPAELRLDDLGDSIVRELRWLQERIDETDRRP